MQTLTLCQYFFFCYHRFRIFIVLRVCMCRTKSLWSDFSDKQNAEGTKDNTHMGEIKFIAHTSRKI